MIELLLLAFFLLLIFTATTRGTKAAATPKTASTRITSTTFYRTATNATNMSLATIPTVNQAAGTCWAYAPIQATEITSLSQKGQAIHIDIAPILVSIGTRNPDNGHIRGKADDCFQYLVNQGTLKSYGRLLPGPNFKEPVVSNPRFGHGDRRAHQQCIHAAVQALDAQ